VVVYANIPNYFSTLTANSGIINIYGGIVQEPLPANYEAPLSYIDILYETSYLQEAYDNQFIILEVAPIHPKPYVHYEPAVFYPTFETTCTGIGREALGFTFLPYIPIKYKLYQIYSTTSFIFAATTEGLEIYDILTENKLCTKKLEQLDLNTVTGNNKTLFVGTSSGIYNLPIINPCAYDLSFIDLNLTDPYVKYLSCKNNYLGVCTNSGVDYFRFNTNPEIHSKSFLSGAEKCVVLKDTLYYTISTIDPITSGIVSKLHRNNTCLTDWFLPTKTYTTGSGIFEEGIKLTDLYITEGTATNGGNTIFCTTTSGVYIIDEDTEEYAIYYTRN
jgi:hypothetical protein